VVFKQDLRPAYEFHRRFLQHLQQRKKARRWVLKAPAHLFALPTLLSIYPDACFVANASRTARSDCLSVELDHDPSVGD
jgi:hypothetical protein